MTVQTVDACYRRVCRTALIATEPGELFELVAQPRQHHELDGSGTVGTTIEGPSRLSGDAEFTTHMKQYGFAYSIMSTVTEFTDDRVIEWRHPMGHRWRWQFEPVGDNATKVTETFDYSTVNGAKAAMFRVIGQARKNASGIENTRNALQARYANG